jgi:hypothetical protein
MPNKFKYNKTGSEAKSIFKGNWAIDTTPNNIGDGPSSVTSFYNGAEIPAGGYALYSPVGVFRATDDTQLLGKLNSLGANVGSASAALTWAAGQAAHAVLNKPIENIITNGLILNLDADHVSSFVDSEPTTNLIPSPTVNSYPTTGNGWGTYNTNQYCGNNGCAVHWDIPAIASVYDNIVTTVSAHQIRSFDVINPATTGGGVNAGQQYFAKKISDTKFSLHDYNSSQDGSQGYLNPTTGRFKVHDTFYLDQRVAINASSFPTKWFGNPHQPNSALVKEVISGGFNVYGHPVTDCMRLHFFRADATDGMAYGVDTSVTIGVPVTTSFWVRAASPSAVGQHIAFQHYNYQGPAGATNFGFAAFTGAQGEWVRRSFTFTPTHSVLISYFFPSSADMKIDIANIQIEQNTSLTPFVPGARSQNNTWYDLSGNGHHATLYNGARFGLTAGVKSIICDGIDDWIGNTTLTGGHSNFTLELMFYHNGQDQGGSYGVLSMGANGNYGPMFYCHNACMGSHYFPGSPSGDYPGGMGYWTNNAWNLFTWVFTDTVPDINGSLKTYVNGVYVDGNSGFNFHNGGMGRGSNGYALGTYSGGGAPYKGSFSQFRVYNRALSAAEVLQNFNANKTRYGL